MIAEEPPDLVLLDLLLPDIDGWELCATIRTLPDPVRSSIPIVMVTARAGERDKLTGLKVGADDYITKPFSVDEVALKAATIVSRRVQELESARVCSEERTFRGLQGGLLHDLKNHLVAVQGFANRIESHSGILPADKIVSYAAFIRRSAAHMASYLEDLLHLDHIETDRLEFEAESFPIREVLDEVVSLLRPLAEEKGIALALAVDAGDPAAEVRFGRAAARICLSNLLENAIKYSCTGCRVAVRVAEWPDGKIDVEVADDGPGIPDGETDRIFEKFYRGELAARTSRGTGLGLYIVRTLADTLGATVSVEAKLREGSRFHLTLPAVQASGSAPPGS